MSYIGNSKSLLIISDNVRDDIIPELVGGVLKDTFELSQEVPGGFEGNITVLRQRYVLDPVVSGTTSDTITITCAGSVGTLSCEDPAIAAALSVIRKNDHKLIIKIENRTPSELNNTFNVTNVVYTGNSILITFAIESITESSSASDIISVSYGFEDLWEVLDPENDYEIVGSGNLQHKLLELKEAPDLNDKVYVLHRAQATYKFAPSPKSVGPEQLSENLRNFVVDRHTVLDSPTDTFQLSQSAVSINSLLVTVNGIVADSTDDELASAGLGQYLYKFAKNLDDTINTLKIQFTSDLPVGANVRITHLGFSTVSRRAKFATGQATSIPDPNTIGELQLKNRSVTEPKLADSAVTSVKIASNAATGDKILLNNNDALRSKNLNGSATEILKLNLNNVTTLQNATEVGIEISGNKRISIFDAAIVPETTGTVTLGTSDKKFGNVYTSGNIVLDENKTVDGVDVSALKYALDALITKVNNGDILPVGSIVIWSSATVPVSRGWLRCDGAALNTYTYKELHAVISNTFGGAAYVAGTTDQATATTTFNLPDLRTRVPVGSNAAGSNLNTNDGIDVGLRTITHKHQGGLHTHDLSNHTHNIPGHYHTQDTVAGSTLAITTSSGHHTTRINHDHLSVRSVESGGFQDFIVWDITQGTGTHNHSNITTDSMSPSSLEHQHRSWYPNACGNLTPGREDNWITAGNIDGIQHRHTISASAASKVEHGHSSSAIGSDTEKQVASNANPDITTSTTRYTAPSGSLEHRHDIPKFYTDSSYGAAGGTNTPGGQLHVPITVSSNGNLFHTHTDTTSVRTRSALYHTHTLSITNSGNHTHEGGLKMYYKGLDAGAGERGLHTHEATNFSGSIGKVFQGSNGNENITTISISTNTSGSNGNVDTSVAASPYIVVNFIIKAK